MYMNFTLTIGSDRRTTIPKNVADQINLKPGRYDVQYIDGKIVIDLNTSEVQENTLINKQKPVKSVKGIKIESNLHESENYSRKVYSDCGLVVRTKKKYITKFCDVCQGTLLVDYPDISQNKCIYFKSEIKQSTDNTDNTNDINDTNDYKQFNETPIQEKVKNKEHYTEYKDVNKDKSDKQFRTNKNVMSIDDYIKTYINKSNNEQPKSDKQVKNIIIENINKNVKKLNDHLDEALSILQPDNSANNNVENNVSEQLEEFSNKVISFKPISGYKHCSQCGELYNKGFYLDDKFICRNCLQTDFKKYLENVRRV